MTSLSFPTSHFYEVDLQPDFFIATSRSRGNESSEVRYADPLWGGSLTTTVLTDKQLKAWEAFISRCSDELVTVDFVDPSFKAPMDYTVASLSALSWPGVTGIGEVNTITDLRTLVCSNVPTNFSLKAGDRVSVTEGTEVAYRIVSEDVVASGATFNLKLTPRLPLGLFTTAAQVRFLNPFVRLRVAPNTWGAPRRGGEANQGQFDVYEAAHS